MSKRGVSHSELEQCPLYTAMQVIAGRWKPMILRRLGENATLGFGELRRALPGVTTKVVRQQLKQLEADGLIGRTVEHRPTLRVHYRLTPHGRTLGPVFETLWAWGTQHLARAKSVSLTDSTGSFSVGINGVLRIVVQKKIGHNRR
jgi:DNA-binding HxlR family transcriptional regulator